MSDATIFAPATAPGRAGVAVIRLSGPAAGPALQLLSGTLPPPRHATRARFVDPASGMPLDDGLALWFPAPASFTGEDVAELQVHGSRAVLAALLEVLGRQPGLRLAEPGEFTRRAFLNGKLTLDQAEGLGDLIAAETEAQRRQALVQAGGALGVLCTGWAARLTRLLALSEAEIDFPDEDLPDSLARQIAAERSAVAAEIGACLADGRRGERLRDGVRVAIVGAPNVGKSTLLNALAGREAAIVSPIAGTTRDAIELALDIGGYPVLLIDTAGLRDTDDPVEQEGVRRARALAAAADLRLLLIDPTQPEAHAPAEADPDTVVVVTKLDLSPRSQKAGMLAVSAATGEGMAALIARLAREAAARTGGAEAALLTRARHRTALEDTLAALEQAASAALPELAAEDLRLAVRALGRITGRVDVEDLLDLVFREFCIGK